MDNDVRRLLLHEVHFRLASMKDAEELTKQRAVLLTLIVIKVPVCLFVCLFFTSTVHLHDPYAMNVMILFHIVICYGRFYKVFESRKFFLNSCNRS